MHFGAGRFGDGMFSDTIVGATNRFGISVVVDFRFGRFGNESIFAQLL
jgi:hypothetical protein